MRDFENTGIHSPTGIRIDGHHNIVQMEVRNEKKDRIFMDQPQASQGEVATGLSQDLATRFSTLYEKPYVVPFSNVSPQMPERAVGVKVGEGTAVQDIRPLKVDVSKMTTEPYKIDRIDEATQPQDLTKSYEKTPLPDTVTPTKPFPEKSSGAFEPDPVFPAQTPAEYKASEKIPISIEYNEKNKIYEVTYDDGSKKKLDMKRTDDKKLYKQLTGREYVVGQSPSKGYKSAMKSVLEGKK